MNISSWSDGRKAVENSVLDRMDPKVRLRYEKKHDSRELQEKLDTFCDERGVDIDRPPKELKNLSLAGRGFERVQEKVFQSVDRLLEDDSDRRDVKNFVNRYSKNLRDSFAEKNGGRHMAAEDAYRLLVQNVAKLALQEHAATECLLGHHGIEHIVTHNMRVAQTLFQKLQESGCRVSATDRLLIDQALVDHDIGYALIADEVRQHGLRGQDKGHPVIAAKLVRESRGSSPLDSILDDSEWSAYHQAVLYHGAPDKEHLGFLLVDSPRQRSQNLEVAVRLADTSHGLDEHKLPPLVLDHPKTLATLRLIQAAGELERPDLVRVARENLMSEIEARPDMSVGKKEAFRYAASQTAPISVKFLVGRFEAGVDQSEEVSNGEVSFKNRANPIRELVYDFFGMDTEGRPLAKLQEETGASSRRDISYDLEGLKPTDGYPKTDFQAQVRSLLTDSPIAAFHRIDAALARSGNRAARVAHLEQFLSRRETAWEGARQLAS